MCVWGDTGVCSGPQVSAEVEALGLWPRHACEVTQVSAGLQVRIPRCVDRVQDADWYVLKRAKGAYTAQVCAWRGGHRR